jgi:hypothetical protein
MSTVASSSTKDDFSIGDPIPIITVATKVSSSSSIMEGNISDMIPAHLRPQRIGGENVKAATQVEMLEVRAAVKDGRELIVCDIGVEKGEASQLEHRWDSERFPCAA